MIKLENNAGLWEAFAGARSFKDGADPLFAEIVVDDVSQEVLEADTGVLILDEQRVGFVGREVVLTLNFMTEEGDPIFYRKALPAAIISREIAQVWAEKHLSPRMTHADLLLAGFEFNPEF